MEGWFQIRSSELSSRKLFKVGKVWVVEIGLEVTECRRNGIKPVIGKHDGLRILEFRERLHVESIVGVRAVGLRSGEVRTMGNRLACQQADMGIVATLGEVVAGFEPILAAAEGTRSLRGEVVRQRQKHLGSERLQQGAPAFARQGGFERTDALGSDDRDAFGLAGQTKELFIPSRLALPDRREMLVFVTEKEDLAEILFRVGFDLRDAV